MFSDYGNDDERLTRVNVQDNRQQRADTDIACQIRTRRKVLKYA